MEGSTLLDLFSLDDESLYEHIFERYVRLENGIDDLKQDLGIQNRNNSQLEVTIAPTEAYFDDHKRKRNKKKNIRNSKKGDVQLDTSTITNTFELVIDQSFTSLNSSRDNNNSTTGYVLWSITPFFIEWLLYSPSSRLFRTGGMFYRNEEHNDENNTVHSPNYIPGLLNLNKDTKTSIIELGSGISGILSIVLGNYVDTYIGTDQRGILNKLKQNIEQNIQQLSLRTVESQTLNLITPELVRGRDNEEDNEEDITTINRKRKPRIQLEIEPLDWETFQLNDKTAPNLYPYLDKIKSDGTETVYILALDVIYNDFLIKPFIHTLKQLLHFYRQPQGSIKDVACLVGIHLRSQEVVTEFLEQAVIEEKLSIWSVNCLEWSQSRFNLYLIK